MRKILEGAIEADANGVVYTSLRDIPHVLAALRIMARVAPQIIEMEAEKAQQEPQVRSPL